MSSWAQAWLFGFVIGIIIGMGPVAAALWFLFDDRRRAR